MISFHCDCGLTEFSAISTTFALLTTKDLSQVNRLKSSNRFMKGKYRMVNAQPLSQDLCLGFWAEGKAKGEVLGPKLVNTLVLNSYIPAVWGRKPVIRAIVTKDATAQSTVMLNEQKDKINSITSLYHIIKTFKTPG